MTVTAFMAPGMRAEIEERLSKLPLGVLHHINIDGKRFAVIRVHEDGAHTGRPRFCVACNSCSKLVHEATTGPIENIELHLEEVAREHTHMQQRLKEAFDVGQLRAKLAEPVPMRLHCPACHSLHIDVGEFADGRRPHHTHACQVCGEVWRPAIVNTVGVRFLPGFKSEDPT